MGNVCQPALRRRYKFSRRTAGRRSTRWVCGSRRRAMCMPWHKHHRLRPIDWCGARGRLSFSCRRPAPSRRICRRLVSTWCPTCDIIGPVRVRKEQNLGLGGCARVKFMRACLFGWPAGWGWYRWDTARQRWAIGFFNEVGLLCKPKTLTGRWTNWVLKFKRASLNSLRRLTHADRRERFH